MWLDALCTNVDRTARNPKLLRWHDRLWLIDHGAALYLQHVGLDIGAAALARRPFPLVAEHVLLSRAGPIPQAGERLRARVLDDAIAASVALVPDEWRLATLAGELSPVALVDHLAALERIAAGATDAGPIAALPPSERFGWLAAPSSTVVQPSEVHTGLCEDPAATLDELYDRLVLSGR